MKQNQPFLESSTPPPTSPDGDDDSNDSIQENESAIAVYLRDEIKIVVWDELAKKHKNVPFALIQERVAKLIDQGKTQGIIVKSLREIPFNPGEMSEHGPLPRDPDYWHNYGFTVGDEDADTLQQMLEMSDPELKEYFIQCGLAKKHADAGF